MAGGFVPARKGAAYNGRFTFLVVMAIVTAGLGGLDYGYDLGVTGGVTGMKTFRAYFFPGDVVSGVTSNWCHFADPYLQLVTSTAYIASIPATLVAFWLAGQGRIKAIFLGGIAYCLAAGLQGGAQNLAMLYAGRAVVGFGMAFCNQAAPVYMSELAPCQHRGWLISMYQFAVTIGILVAQLINYGTGKMSGEGWRISLSMFGLPGLLLVLWSPFLPDSPESLISRGQQEKAKQTLQRVRGTPDIELEWADMLAETAEGQRRKAQREALAAGAGRWAATKATLDWAWGFRVQLGLCFMLGNFRALTGNPVLLFYAPELFQTLGTTQDYSLLSAVTQGVAKVFGNVLAVCLIDRVGRKKLQFVGGVGMLAMQVAAAVITGVWFNGTSLTDPEAWSLTVVLCLFEVFFELSIATLSWVIAAEICPLEIRNVGAGFHVMGDLSLQVFYSQLTLTMMCHMKFYVFVMSAGFCVLFILVAAFLIPETQGLPLESVQEALRQHWLYGGVMQRAERSRVSMEAVVAVSKGSEGGDGDAAGAASCYADKLDLAGGEGVPAQPSPGGAAADSSDAGKLDSADNKGAAAQRPAGGAAAAVPGRAGSGAGDLRA